MQILLANLTGTACAADMLGQLDGRGAIHGQMFPGAETDIFFLEQGTRAGFSRITDAVT
jgi:hypothetical protein